MATDGVPDNLEFLLGDDPVEIGESTAEGTPTESTETPQEAAPAPQETYIEQPESAEERRFRGVLNELRDTRQERRALQAELAAIREERERQQEAYQRQNAPAPPNKDEDPAAWLAYQNRVALEEIEYRRQEEAREYQSQVESQQVRQQFFGTVTELEGQFRQERPDYDQAVGFLKATRAQELESQGFAPDQVHDQLQREIVGYTALQLRNGQSPAKAAYDYAVSRGYRGSQQQYQAPAQPYYAPQSPRLNHSLSGVSGGGGGAGINLDNLASQPPSVQNAVMDNPETWERINLGETIYV